MREAAPPMTRPRRVHVAALLPVVLVLSCGSTAAPADDAIAKVPAPDVHVPEVLAAAAAQEAAGDLTAALATAETALAGGGGRDAALTVAKLAILLEQYDRAASVLEPVVASDPTDAIAQYDLALVHHRRNDYNKARKGYLAALRADPQHADARFNLAMLCWKKGVVEEARHHVDRFREAFPADPRGAELVAMTRPAAALAPAGG